MKAKFAESAQGPGDFAGRAGHPRTYLGLI
jgi:hypothetical protein